MLIYLFNFALKIIVSNILLYFVWQYSDLIIKNVFHKMGHEMLTTRQDAHRLFLLFILDQLGLNFLVLFWVQINRHFVLVAQKRVIGSLDLTHVLVGDQRCQHSCFLIHFIYVLNT